MQHTAKLGKLSRAGKKAERWPHHINTRKIRDDLQEKERKKMTI